VKMIILNWTVEQFTQDHPFDAWDEDVTWAVIKVNGTEVGRTKVERWRDGWPMVEEAATEWLAQQLMTKVKLTG
jgi:hypothetical protein